MPGVSAARGAPPPGWSRCCARDLSADDSLYGRRSADQHPRLENDVTWNQRALLSPRIVEQLDGVLFDVAIKLSDEVLDQIDRIVPLGREIRQSRRSRSHES